MSQNLVLQARRCCTYAICCQGRKHWGQGRQQLPHTHIHTHTHTQTHTHKQTHHRNHFLEQNFVFLRKIRIDEREGVDEKSGKKCHKKEGVQLKKCCPSHKFFYVLFAVNKL